VAFIVAPIAGRADSLLAGLSDGAARGNVKAHDNDSAAWWARSGSTLV
jgi:hypothetical protein